MCNLYSIAKSQQAIRDLVKPIHPDATPVLLLNEGAREMWMNAPMKMTLTLQRPSPNNSLRNVATDTKQDEL
jgi:putative SOS response-associated peptidase YedK